MSVSEYERRSEGATPGFIIGGHTRSEEGGLEKKRPLKYTQYWRVRKGSDES